jgi:ABC-type sugar transport system ATPase subunit
MIEDEDAYNKKAGVLPGSVFQLDEPLRKLITSGRQSMRNSLSAFSIHSRRTFLSNL